MHIFSTNLCVQFYLWNFVCELTQQRKVDEKDEKRKTIQFVGDGREPLIIKNWRETIFLEKKSKKRKSPSWSICQARCQRSPFLVDQQKVQHGSTNWQQPSSSSQHSLSVINSYFSCFNSFKQFWNTTKVLW